MPKASVAPNAPRRARGPLTLTSIVHLKAADGRVFEVTPQIEQTLKCDWLGLADADALLFSPPTFRFDMIVPRGSVVDPFSDANDDEVAAEEELWNSLRAAYPVQPKNNSDVQEDEQRPAAVDELWLAHCTVADIPTHIVEQAGGWYDVCDATGDTLHAALGLILEVANTESERYGTSLIEGSLLWPQLLGVHPRARGQDIGIRLLAHALWALHRTTSDFVVLQAAPVASHFDAIVPEADPCRDGSSVSLLRAPRLSAVEAESTVSEGR